MLGWHVSVYRRQAPAAGPVGESDERGELLAQWQGGLSSLDWLDELSTKGSCLDLGGNGYPNLYTAPCGALRPVIVAGPPNAGAVWLHDPGDIIDWSKWKGKTFVDHERFEEVPEDEWLLVVAWDES